MNFHNSAFLFYLRRKIALKDIESVSEVEKFLLHQEAIDQNSLTNAFQVLALLGQIIKANLI